jgi:hypothetical protein
MQFAHGAIMAAGPPRPDPGSCRTIIFSSSGAERPTTVRYDRDCAKAEKQRMISQPATQLTLSAAVDRLSAHAADWSTSRVLDEGLDLVRDCSWADGSVLYAAQDDRVVTLCRRPSPGPHDAPGVDLPVDWFPWGLAPVNPRRFIFVENAAALPAGPAGRRTLGDLEVSSCLHLPILERQQTIGALHLFWTEPRLVWDDDCGRILRSLGRFLLARAAAPPAVAAAGDPADRSELDE